MRGFWKLAITEFKLFLREPSAFFFTIVFPLMMLFLFGSVFGNKPQYYGKFGTVDLSVPAYTAMIIATTGLMSLTIIISSAREQGILRRLQATPLRPLTILSAQVLVLFCMTAIGMILLVIAARIVYGLRFDGNVLAVVICFLLSSASFFALGFILASVLRTARTAQVVAMVLYYPMLFLSGAAIPKWILPEGVRTYGQILPLTHVVNLLTGVWLGDALSAHYLEIGVLAGMLVIGMAISSKTFRWE